MKAVLLVLLMSPLLALAPGGLATHCVNNWPWVASSGHDLPVHAAGYVAWDGLTVTFHIGGGDPDGDPVTPQYRWSDEGIWRDAPDGQVSRTFALGLAPGTTMGLTFSHRALDDPSARCPDAAPRASGTSSYAMTVHATPQITVLSPRPGESCHLGEVAPSWNNFDLVAGHCDIDIAVTTSLPPAILDTSALRVDGALHATGAIDAGAIRYTSGAVGDGPHDMMACAWSTQRPEATFCTVPWRYVDSDCTNLAPEPVGVIADGMMGGGVGWVGLPYTLQAVAYDVEGDPFTVSWRFADGSTATGPTVARAFPTVGTFSATLTLTDSVSGRCPHLQDETATVAVPVFRTIADPVVSLTRPGNGNSCDLNTVFPSNGQDAIAVSCEVEAQLASEDIEAWAVDAAVFRLDGAFYGEARGTKTIRSNYNAADRPEGMYTLDACWTLAADKHDRAFCSDAYTFQSIDCSNRAPTLGSVYFDGMGTNKDQGWVGRTYTFDARTSYDLDRDPMIATWTWSDGLVQTGLQVTRSFATAGSYTATLLLEDDPTTRCPFMPSYAVATDVRAFSTVEVPVQRMILPGPRHSCYGATWITTSTQENVVSGRCTVQARLEGAASSLSSLLQGELRVDGRPFFRGTGSAAVGVYDSVMFTTGGHVMDACFSAKGDKHALRLCTEEYIYLNIGT